MLQKLKRDSVLVYSKNGDVIDIKLGFALNLLIALKSRKSHNNGKIGYPILIIGK